MSNPDNSHRRRPTVVYIAGNHRSGSTLLDMVLGSHSRALSIGEIVALGEYFRQNKLCTCGEHIHDCEFWGEVQDRLANDLGLQAPCSRYAPIHSASDLLRGLAPLPVSVSARYDRRLLEAISAVSGRDVIVDSSKTFSRLLFYLVAYGGRTFVIHLTRDPRGVINSLLRTKEYATERLDLYIRWWKNTQSRLHRLSALLGPSRIIHLRFEDFCRNPADNLAPVLNALHLAFEPRMLDYGSLSHHNISGNIKTRKRTVTAITFREAWRDELPSNIRSEIERRLGRHMSRVGYL
jgi:hypothetical protein